MTHASCIRVTLAVYACFISAIDDIHAPKIYYTRYTRVPVVASEWKMRRPYAANAPRTGADVPRPHLVTDGPRISRIHRAGIAYLQRM